MLLINGLGCRKLPVIYGLFLFIGPEFLASVSFVDHGGQVYIECYYFVLNREFKLHEISKIYTCDSGHRSQLLLFTVISPLL